MADYRLSSIAQLARQMNFAPLDVRMAQVDRAEELLHTIDPARSYPLDFVIYRITDYRPRDRGEVLPAAALQHDLGLLIEQVSQTLGQRTDARAEPVLTIEDVCARFDVTSKTIQRWRRRGLCARRFVFPDGKARVGFRLSSVERFLSRSASQEVQPPAAAPISEMEVTRMLAEARRLIGRCECCAAEAARRIARRAGRSPLAVLHILRKHDQEHPDDPVLAGSMELLPSQKAQIVRLHRRGATLSQVMRSSGAPRSAAYRAILDDRLSRLMRRRMAFHDDELFKHDDAGDLIDVLVAQEDLGQPPRGEDLRVPRGLPPSMEGLYRTPLLTPARERALFLKLNWLKFRFAQARRKLEPQTARNRDLRALEELLDEIADTRNRIVRANLRLVVSVAKRHLRPGVSLNELVSDGTITLLRAVDGFDIARGNRFSTYATFALMKGFARSVPRMLADGGRCEGDPHYLDLLPDRHPAPAETFVERDQVQALLSHLDERERRIIAGHFGLNDERQAESYEQVGQRLGLSKERVRQIEQSALAKLRAATALPRAS